MKFDLRRSSDSGCRLTLTTNRGQRDQALAIIPVSLSSYSAIICL
ncbi:hypothetical protein CFBP3846_05230 [Pseudomonas syringae pv. avii]|uniref:Uncharacterized protein n=3 Tax=Pseudomonas syringae group TaxID=136849 RepID=A0A2K4U2W9_9PSED|nr:hypothetical protein ALQ30_200113 [Pseudomonas syringae pv. persicae]RMU39692.1 hypothetical protein ALP29_200367 [Pseudomonas syringae pv. avii]SOQ14930.1 hypothetical protein CFBP1573P_05256 [Pseudomonas syringae pv. persicae]SOQ15012.1 hypothetical protein NCPPB2254_05273 [Pseudomonas syringae pv. persicae]SOS29597.1 hypothetical protein CFBP3846_05230 [Pseudomonas syringae pv. avii]